MTTWWSLENKSLAMEACFHADQELAKPSTDAKKTGRQSFRYSSRALEIYRVRGGRRIAAPSLCESEQVVANLYDSKKRLSKPVYCVRA